MKRDVLDVLRQQFRPEFLNSVDETVVFHSLTREDLKKIVDIQLGRLRARLEERHITLDLTDQAREYFATTGYDPSYGARPLKRLLQRELETSLGRKLLAGDIHEHARVVVDWDGDALTFTPYPQAEITISLEDTSRGVTKSIGLQTTTYGPDGAAHQITKHYEVKIPAGVTEGSRIRLAGQGSAPPGGGPRGDLFLRVHLAPHPQFTVDHYDLLVDVPVSPWEAALGAKVAVPSLNGKVKMTVPPGAQGGKRFRLRGKGLPRGGRERGDLYATVQITVPRVLTPKERDLFVELQKVSAVDPRKAESSS
jgi:curved DNA-binding protein CbpA